MNFEWHKSSYSAQGNNCVETRQARDSVNVRDSKQGTTGPVLSFDTDAWRQFITDAKAGKHQI